MLSSLLAGPPALPDSTAACLVVMGDQPVLDGRVLGRVLSAYAEGRGGIVIPTRPRRARPPGSDRVVVLGRMAAQEHGAPRERHFRRRDPEHTALVEVRNNRIVRYFDTPGV